MTPELWLIVLGAAAAGFVQGLSGFGFSMVAMSFWVWGIAPQTAAVLAVFGSLVGQVVASFSVRHPPGWWPALWPFLLGAAVGVPIGVLVLPMLNADAFRLALGGLLAVWCPVMLFADRLPRLLRSPPGTGLGRIADTVVGAIGGFMGGLGGFTGAVPTLWCTLRGMDKAAQRAIVQNFNLAALAVTMLGYTLSQGINSRLWPSMGLVVVALLLPSLIGTRVYARLSALAFRRVVLSLLSLSGLAMLATSVPRLLGWSLG
jgi:uncharacterized membrane protein YfcA